MYSWSLKFCLVQFPVFTTGFRFYPPVVASSDSKSAGTASARAAHREARGAREQKLGRGRELASQILPEAELPNARPGYFTASSLGSASLLGVEAPKLMKLAMKLPAGVIGYEQRRSKPAESSALVSRRHRLPLSSAGTS